MIIGMVMISLIYAMQSYVTFQINAEQLVDSVAVKNEAISTNMIQRLDLFIDKRVEEFKTLERTREIRQILEISNKQFSQIDDLENFMQEKTIQGDHNRNLPFIAQAIEEKYSNDLTSIVTDFDQEFGYDYADEFFITNSYGANIVLILGKADYDQSDKEWWHDTRTDRVHIGDIQYNVNYDNYSIPIVIGIYDEEDTFLGTIRVLIGIEKMISEFVTNAKILENQNKYAMLLTHDGRIIYSDHVVFDQGNYIEYYDEKRMVGPAGHFVLNSNSEKTVVSFARSDYSESNGLGWIATVSENESNIVKSLGTVINSILFPSLIGIVLIIVVVVTVTVFVSKPLNRLAFLSSSLAKGNFDVKAEDSKIQEIKTISSSFNELSQSLKKLILTEKALAESKIKIRNERLSAIGELSASMAHDLKNPLAVIKASSDILKRKFGKQNKDDKLDRLFYNMDDAVSRMSHQVKDVLDYVRTTPLEISDSSLKKIIHDSIKSLNIPKNIAINLPEKDLTIKCDVRKIEVVFINLILNAIQAIGEKNDGRISILANDENQDIVIQVQNTGEDIPDELLSNVFDPLFTTKYQGTGLGLSTCKNVIKQHGGSISVSNSPTTFHIILPKNIRQDSEI